MKERETSKQHTELEDGNGGEAARVKANRGCV